MSLGNMPAPQEEVAVDDAPVGPSVINARTSIDGALVTDTNLRVEGQLTGTLQCGGILFVTEGANVDATVDAGGIIVEGTLKGTIICHGRLEIRPTGVVSGEVDTGRLVILEGAIYEGRLRMEAAVPAAPKLAGEPAEPAPPPSAAPVNPYSYFRSAAQQQPSQTDAPTEPVDDELP
jgi:cytoskeletal protein CcmA (bactofilin family)